MSLTANKIASEVKITQYDFDPNTTDATAVAWVDMKDFSKFIASFFRTVGTSNITFIIQGSADAAGGTPSTIITKTVASQPNAVGDYIFAECTAEQIRQVGDAAGKVLRYISATISFGTNTDEGVVTYIRGGPRFAYDELTADYVS